MNNRSVLVVPIEELTRHFSLNERQDVKLIVPKLLDEGLASKLQARGKTVKPEEHLADTVWSYSSSTEPNRVLPASELPVSGCSCGSFSVAFANEHAEQGEHYHAVHSELYFSESRFEAEYRHRKEKAVLRVTLANGGMIVFWPEVIHRVKLGGLTLVVECPAVEGDRISDCLTTIS